VRRDDREVAARRVVLRGKRRDEPAVLEVLGDQRNAPERHALSRDRRLDHLVVQGELDRSDRFQAGLPVGVEPRRPVEPRHEAAGVVEVDQHVAREIGRCPERRSAARERGARHRQQPLAEQAHGVARCAHVGEVANRNVDVAAREVRHPVVGGDVDVGRRVRRTERRQARDQPQRGERHRRRHGEARLPLDRAHRVGGGSEVAQLLGHSPVECRARGRQRERAVPPLEQRDAERSLQRLDLPGERRLRDEELLGGQCERQAPARGLEAAEEVEGWQAAQCLVHSCNACNACAFSV